MISPLLTALIGVIVERLMSRRIYNRDPVYSLLLTFGLAFVLQDGARYIWGPNGLPMGLPAVLAQPITSTLFFITWYRVFMVGNRHCDRDRPLNFAVGCLLAGLSGVLAAGQIGLNPNMGDELLMPSFIAIIVGGVGSLIGTLFGGLLIGMAAALTTVFYPAASEAVIYAIMMAVLLLRPRGLIGEEGMMS